jgi:hypothetical protein
MVLFLHGRSLKKSRSKKTRGYTRAERPENGPEARSFLTNTRCLTRLACVGKQFSLALSGYFSKQKKEK